MWWSFDIFISCKYLRQHLRKLPILITHFAVPHLLYYLTYLIYLKFIFAGKTVRRTPGTPTTKSRFSRIGIFSVYLSERRRRRRNAPLIWPSSSLDSTRRETAYSKNQKLRPLKPSIYSLRRRRRRRVDGNNIPHHLRRSIETIPESIDLIRVGRDANFRTVWSVEISKAQDADAFSQPPPPPSPLQKKKKKKKNI